MAKTSENPSTIELTAISGRVKWSQRPLNISEGQADSKMAVGPDCFS